MGPFWPRKTLLGVPEGQEGQEESNLVPTATNWSDWVRIMVTIHFGLISGLSWAPRAPKRASFGPKRPFWGSQRYLEI